MQTRKISHVAPTLHNSTRFVILALATLCLSLVVSNSLALNFTIICMTNEGKNDTTSDYDYTPIQQSWLFSIIAVGQFIGTVGLQYGLAKYDIRKIFSLLGLVSGIATLLTPLSAYIGYYPLLFMRLLQGLAMATSFAGIGSITTQWSTVKENGMFISLLSCHFQIGSVFTMPVAGVLCESEWGWPALYYLQGSMTTVAFVVFYLFYRDDPYWHGLVSDKELSRIERGKVSVVSRDSNISSKHYHPKVPYRAIFTDKVFYGVQIGVAGVQFGFVLFVQYGPVYMNKVLKFDIKSTGVGTALPYVASIIMKVIAGPLSDRATCVSAKNNVKIFTTISNSILALGTLSLAFITMDSPLLAQLAFIVALAFSGLNSVGSLRAAQLMSQQFSHVMMNVLTLISSLIILVLPMIIEVLTPNNTHEEWSTIFIGVSIIIFAGMMTFNFMAEVEPRPWVKNSSTKNKIFQISTISKGDILPDEKDVEKTNDV